MNTQRLFPAKKPGKTDKLFTFPLRKWDANRHDLGQAKNRSLQGPLWIGSRGTCKLEILQWMELPQPELPGVSEYIPRTQRSQNRRGVIWSFWELSSLLLWCLQDYFSGTHTSHQHDKTHLYLLKAKPCHRSLMFRWYRQSAGVCFNYTANRISFCLWPPSREIILKTLKQAFFCWIIVDNYISLSKKIRKVEITGVTGRRVDWRGSGEIKHCQFVLWTANACFIIIVYRFLCWYTSNCIYGQDFANCHGHPNM